MTRVTENDVHVATETYLNQMRRKYRSQNDIVATRKHRSSSKADKENEGTKLLFSSKFS